MSARPRTRIGSAMRRAIAVAAAYLIVLQAALAGVALERMHAVDGFAAGTICLNGGASAPDADDGGPGPFECCGVGCLAAAHALDEPPPSDVVPVRTAEAPAEPTPPAELRRERPYAEGPSPRGPPAAA